MFCSPGAAAGDPSRRLADASPPGPPPQRLQAENARLRAEAERKLRLLQAAEAQMVGAGAPAEPATSDRASGPEVLSASIEGAVQEAEAACEDGTAAECAAAWDEVEELSAEAAHQKAARDPPAAPAFAPAAEAADEAEGPEAEAEAAAGEPVYEALSASIEDAVQEAEATCEDGTTAECAAAWDEVEELSAEAAHQKEDALLEEAEPAFAGDSAAAAGGAAPEDLARQRSDWKLFFAPEGLEAGGTVTLYVNRRKLGALADRPSIFLNLGFNAWELNAPEPLSLAPANVPRTDAADWWAVEVAVPDLAFECNFVLHDGQGLFDNNAEANYNFPVAGSSPEAWAAAKAEREAARQAEEERARAEAAAAAEAERLAALEAAEAAEGRRLAAEARGFDAVGAAEGSPRRGAATVWATEPAQLVAGERATVTYDPAGGPLAGAAGDPGQEIFLYYGHNDWQGAGEVRMTAVPSADRAKFEAEVEVPRPAAALMMVFHDGQGTYDNNDRADFKAAVALPAAADAEAWWADVAAAYTAELAAERLAREEAERAQAAARAARRAELAAYSKTVRRRQQHHLYYCEPAEPHAGEEVAVVYNPESTDLRGAERVFLSGGFNRWEHASTFEGVEMRPVVTATGESRVEARVKVPKDAYMMDFVFSDAPGPEGNYDSNWGLDYHEPVVGGAQSPPLYVAHIAVEMAPIAKVGGLGDVVTALARCVQERGHHVEIILPRFDFLLASPLLQDLKYETEFDWGGCKNFVSTCVVEGVRVFFIEPSNGYFKVDSVYGRDDDPVRFDFFCKAALEFLLQSGRQPDILHCHDWSSAEVSRAYWEEYHPYGLWNPKVVFTIHNLNYGAAKIGEAAMHCQKFTTVSPTYAMEVSDHPSIHPHALKFVGIRNGIDFDIWDPSNDQFLPQAYSKDSVVEGKGAARHALQERLGLRRTGDIPVVGVVSRLTHQKGIHLIKHAAWRARDRGAQFVLLGSAPDPKVQAEFDGLANELQGDMAAFVFTYDEPLSHLIYAGCDMILVPSMFEPCGLTQMIAMRYGAVPVVRSTGGLHDTVFDVDHDEARGAWEVHGLAAGEAEEGLEGTNGFAFDGTDEGSLDYALNRAIDSFYNDKAWFQALQKRAASQDWSWNRPAESYEQLYYAARHN